MTEQEEQEFLDLVDYGTGNHYEILGLIPFSEFNDNYYYDRREYVHIKITDSEIRNNGLKILNLAKSTLFNKHKKKLYDISLKKRLKRRLVELIEFSVLLDNTLTSIDREKLDIFGKSYGFSIKEIYEVIQEQRKERNFNDSIRRND